ncbi:MAG: cryptochrome/photolyase family protein [Bacteroidales bacterium]
MKKAIFWFRRDLRTEDNKGLSEALRSGYPVLPLFIFDPDILEELNTDDPRVSFIYGQLKKIHRWLRSRGSSLMVRHGKPLAVWKEILHEHQVSGVYLNKDYEPYAIGRDRQVEQLLASKKIPVHRMKDQVIFEEDEVLKKDGAPYTVFTPYKKRWLEQFRLDQPVSVNMPEKGAFVSVDLPFADLEQIGFRPSPVSVPPYDLSGLDHYDELRNFPAADATSRLSPHLRFGTVGIRQLVGGLKPGHESFLSELIWREFFMQILYHFPRVVDTNFHSKYDGIRWRNNEEEFRRWSQGETGYPLVDAGMRQLNQTGFMHNRVRMVTASFLCKHLLIDWRWGEAYFAEKLLDYELSSNNGNWQWAAGTGCDAAPYFRIFNPHEQLRKFDENLEYVRQWVPEAEKAVYITPMVEHKFARNRALETYKKGITA